MKSSKDLIMEKMYEIHSKVSDDSFEEFFENYFNSSSDEYDTYFDKLWEDAKTELVNERVNGRNYEL